VKPTLPDALDRIEAAHGKPPRALPKRALDWVLWENCAYLVSDERRRKAYQELRARTGLLPAGILALSREELREIAALGGMHPNLRVRKLIAIAESVQTTFGGDLGRALKLPLAQARRALKTFPGIGAPGADKILLFTRTHALPALESNGLRTLVRLGHAKEGKSYAATYRAAICALEPYVDRGAAWLIRAHWLLRMHGRVLCKHKGPLCDACTLQENCPSAE
jgi:endonuclease III